jgi:hypothetical protein
MSYLIAAPDMLGAAAADVAGIGSSLSEANAAAAASTTTVIAAAEDEVSAAIASLFSGHGQAFQALSAQAAAFHSQFGQAPSMRVRVPMRAPRPPMRGLCRPWSRMCATW